MPLGTLTTLSAILFRDYDKVVRDNTFSETVLLNNLKKNVGVIPMANNNFYVKATSSGFGGWDADNGAAGADLQLGDVTYAEMTVPIVFTWGGYQLTESVLRSADGDAGAVVDIAEDYAKHVQQSLRRNLNRMFLNRGGTVADNAVIATVNGASSGTTVTVDDGAGSDSSGPGLGTQFMYVGQGITIGTDAEQPATADYATISSIDSRTQITIDASETIADSDNIVIARSAAANNDNNEMSGFRNINLTTGTFQNVDRSTNYWWHSSSDTTAEALDEGDLIAQFNQAKRTGNPNAVIMGEILYRKYASLLTSMKQAEVDAARLEGGFRGLALAVGGPGTVVSLDWDCPYGDVNIASLSSQYITIGELATGWFGAKQGLPLFQKTNLRGSYWAAYEYFGNLVVRNASAHSGLRNKTA